MNIKDFVNTIAPLPDWLTKAWSDAERRGLDKLTMQEIDPEIAAARIETQAAYKPRWSGR